MKIINLPKKLPNPQPLTPFPPGQKKFKSLPSQTNLKPIQAPNLDPIPPNTCQSCDTTPIKSHPLQTDPLSISVINNLWKKGLSKQDGSISGPHISDSGEKGGWY